MNSSSTAERVIGGGKGIRGDRADCAQCLTILMLQRLLGLTDLYRVAAMSIGRINQCHWAHGEGGKERERERQCGKSIGLSSKAFSLSLSLLFLLTFDHSDSSSRLGSLNPTLETAADAAPCFPSQCLISLASLPLPLCPSPLTNLDSSVQTHCFFCCRCAPIWANYF